MLWKSHFTFFTAFKPNRNLLNCIENWKELTISLEKSRGMNNTVNKNQDCTLF